MIGKLTPKQIERLTYYRDKWLAIGLSTQKADRKMAETGITKAYKIAGLKRPKIVWTLSPLSSGLTRYCVFEILKNKSAIVWDSVRDSVGASVRDSVWASVGDSVWASVWAYISSFFDIQYKYDFSPAIKLWERGLVPSFDGTTWRLHSGENAEVVYNE